MLKNFFARAVTFAAQFVKTFAQKMWAATNRAFWETVAEMGMPRGYA